MKKRIVLLAAVSPMLKKFTITAAATAALVLAGCASVPHPSAEPFLGSVQAGADGLFGQMNSYPLKSPLIVASAQNGDHLSQVCPQGRLIADIVSSRLTQRGLPVTEVRLAQSLRISSSGETILSRELADLAKSINAEVVVAATWSTLLERPRAIFVNADGSSSSPQSGTTYVTLKAVRIADGLVIGSHTFTPPAAWHCNYGR